MDHFKESFNSTFINKKNINIYIIVKIFIIIKI